ncbi:hypothetical protein [Phascolarctobacterium sp.]
MRLIDLVMATLMVNACKDIDIFSYIIFACGAVYVAARIWEVCHGREEK